jgi:hypothetical protein
MLAPMKTIVFVAALAAVLFALPASAEKPRDLPYAAGAPYGGIPQWQPGDKFVAVAGGECSGSCPVYELYVFEDGRVTFVGRKYTGKQGVWKKQVSPNAYAELLTTIIRMRVLDQEIKRKTCLKGRPMLKIMRSQPDTNGGVRTVDLNSGCEGHADVARDIEKLFIDWTEVANWIASK